MKYIGLDIHKDTTYAVVKDKEGNQIQEGNLNNEKNRFIEFLDDCNPSETKIVMESTCVWEWIYEFLEEQGYEVILANPLRTKAIASARVKTDKVDAETLADLLRANLIAESYVPPKEIRIWRNIVRQKRTLTKGQTQIANKIHALLRQRGIKLPWKTLGKKSLQWISDEFENKHLFGVMQTYLNLYEDFEKEMEMVEEEIKDIAEKDDEAQLLMTIPGIGSERAVQLLAEIGEYERFSNSGELCSYAGLVPSVRQSGSTIKFGRLTKQANSSIKHTLVQASWTIVRMRESNPLQEFYKKLSEKKGKQKAICATARKLGTVVYAILQKHQPFIFM